MSYTLIPSSIATQRSCQSPIWYRLALGGRWRAMVSSVPVGICQNSSARSANWWATCYIAKISVQRWSSVAVLEISVKVCVQDEQSRNMPWPDEYRVFCLMSESFNCFVIACLLCQCTYMIQKQDRQWNKEDGKSWWCILKGLWWPLLNMIKDDHMSRTWVYFRLIIARL